MTWRVGRTLGRTLYRDEVCVGMVDDAETADYLAAAANQRGTCARAAADYLLEHAEQEATGSRDFGRGYGQAIQVLRRLT